MTHTNKKDFNTSAQPAHLSEMAPRPELTIDVDYFQQFLDCPDLCEEQKREMIEILWSIVVSVVDLGFGVHPVQQAKRQETELADMLQEIAREDGVFEKRQGDSI